MVLIATVFPPVFGPVITSPLNPGPILIVMGTALFPRRGCRAPTRLITLSDPAGIVPIRLPPIDIDNRARAAMRSIPAAASKEISASSSRSPINREARRKMRSSSL